MNSEKQQGEGGKRERERKRARETETERESVCVCARKGSVKIELELSAFPTFQVTCSALPWPSVRLSHPWSGRTSPSFPCPRGQSPPRIGSLHPPNWWTRLCHHSRTAPVKPITMMTTTTMNTHNIHTLRASTIAMYDKK